MTEVAGAAPVRGEDAIDVERVATWLRENASATAIVIVLASVLIGKFIRSHRCCEVIGMGKPSSGHGLKVGCDRP